jgi:hypothetical protein
MSKEDKEIMETEGDVTWEREELYHGFGDWNRKVNAVLFHLFTWKIIAFALLAMTVIHFTATAALALERDSVYKTTGSTVRFEYNKHLFSLPGYDVILKRREFHDRRETLAEAVRKERERELELQEFQLKREEYRKQRLRLSDLPDAPGAEILEELGMAGPGGH